VLLLVPILRLKWCEMPRAGVRTLVGVSITCATRRGFSEGLMVLPQRCTRHGASGDLPPAQDLAWRRLEVALKTGGPRERMHSCLGAGDAVRHGLAGPAYTRRAERRRVSGYLAVPMSGPVATPGTLVQPGMSTNGPERML